LRNRKLDGSDEHLFAPERNNFQFPIQCRKSPEWGNVRKAKIGYDDNDESCINSTNVHHFIAASMGFSRPKKY
jgi:hypothetical protein